MRRRVGFAQPPVIFRNVSSSRGRVSNLFAFPRAPEHIGCLRFQVDFVRIPRISVCPAGTLDVSRKCFFRNFHIFGLIGFCLKTAFYFLISFEFFVSHSNYLLILLLGCRFYYHFLFCQRHIARKCS